MGAVLLLDLDREERDPENQAATSLHGIALEEAEGREIFEAIAFG